MFASNRVSRTATKPITLSVIGTAGEPPVAERAQTVVSEDATASQSWLANEQAISLRRRDDEPALEYGCVDWFIYDEQRSQ
jgi:hypothetical protein